MRIKTRLLPLLLAFLTILFTTIWATAGGGPPATDSLVNDFPTLDQLETHMGLTPATEDGEGVTPATVHVATETPGGRPIFPVSERWYTAGPSPNPFDGERAAHTGEPAEKPLASLLTRMDADQKEAGVLHKEIHRENNLPINKYLLDRIAGHAETDYGTDITGLFVNGVGFGSFQQTLRQSYGATYSLPLLQRYSDSHKWTRVLSGWTINSSAGVMPQLLEGIQVRQLLNNLQFTWSVSLNYDISSATVRKIYDHQYDKEAAFGKAAGRAAAAREELLKRMALRIDALSAHPQVRDTRLSSLRELYPQFELYQERYVQATSCDDRMEDFFTLKGLALSLLTMAGYDRPDNSGNNLLQTWKRARFAACGGTT